MSNASAAHHLAFHLNVVVVDGRLPTRGSPESAGLDLYAAADVTIDPFRTGRVRLGIRTSFPPGWVGVIKDRSSLAAAGIETCGGVIDSDYRGEWSIVLANRSGAVWRAGVGDRVAQVLFVPVGLCNPNSVVSVGDSERGTNGFGSTGR